MGSLQAVVSFRASPPAPVWAPLWALCPSDAWRTFFLSLLLWHWWLQGFFLHILFAALQSFTLSYFFFFQRDTTRFLWGLSSAWLWGSLGFRELVPVALWKSNSSFWAIKVKSSLIESWVLHEERLVMLGSSMVLVFCLFVFPSCLHESVGHGPCYLGRLCSPDHL